MLSLALIALFILSISHIVYFCNRPNVPGHKAWQKFLTIRMASSSILNSPVKRTERTSAESGTVSITMLFKPVEPKEINYER